jgi:hypothetical protein
MSNTNSDSSEFWNLYQKRHERISESSESSEFWNLYRKNYKKYSVSEEFSSDDEDPSKEQDESNDLIPVTLPTDQKTTVKSSTSGNQSELENSSLPPKQLINDKKKISDYTIIEFYNSFMKNIIDIVKSLKQGKGLNTLFNDRERLLHLGIGLIILSVILVPLALN